MIGVLDLETIKTDRNSVKDTWLLRLPKEVCDKKGFAEGTLVSLTVKNGGIQSSFIRPPSNKLKEISRKLLEKDRELHRRLKEIENKKEVNRLIKKHDQTFQKLKEIDD